MARARWDAFSGVVPKTKMIPADVVGCRRIVRDAVNGVQMVTVSGLRAAVGLRRLQCSNLAREFLDGFHEPGRVVGRRRGDTLCDRLESDIAKFVREVGGSIQTAESLAGKLRLYVQW